jgi:hypothetical protein
MKTKNSLLLLLGMISFYTLITSSNCKKEDEPSAYDKLQGRWNFQNAVASSYNHNTNQLISSQTFPAGSGDYAEFRNNGRVYLQIGGPGNTDTTGYQLLGDNRLVFGDAPNLDTTDIVTLNTTDFAFRFKEIYSSNPVIREETTYNFKK